MLEKKSKVPDQKSFFDIVEEGEADPCLLKWTKDYSKCCFCEEEFVHSGVLTTFEDPSKPPDVEYYILMQTALVKCSSIKIQAKELGKKGTIQAVLALKNPRVEKVEKGKKQ